MFRGVFSAFGHAGAVCASGGARAHGCRRAAPSAGRRGCSCELGVGHHGLIAWGRLESEVA
jgi:hypothetical protein